MEKIVNSTLGEGVHLLLHRLGIIWDKQVWLLCGHSHALTHGGRNRTQLTCRDLELWFCDSMHCSRYQQRVCEHLEDTELSTATLCSLALSPHTQGGAGQAAENYSWKLQSGNVELEPCRTWGSPGITQSTLAAAKPGSNMPVTLAIDVCLGSPEDPSQWRSHFVL